MEKEIAFKLMNIQQILDAPKGQRNTFGNYNYRSAEDILKALKKPLVDNKCALIMSDAIEVHEGLRYIKATATIIDAETGQSLSSTALAREALEKKGMDCSQVTGATSSYARKYALNALFAIDDNKDFDTDEAYRIVHSSSTSNNAASSNSKPKKDVVSDDEAEKIIAKINAVKTSSEFNSLWSTLSDSFKNNKKITDASKIKCDEIRKSK